MLVLSRKPNEKILLPSLDITVQVVSITRNSVRIGIEAPPHVTVLREELQTRQTWPDVPTVVPVKAEAPRRPGLGQLLANRLKVARTGVVQLRQLVQAGDYVEMLEVLGKLEEDFEMLGQRLDTELVQDVAPTPRAAGAERELAGSHR